MRDETLLIISAKMPDEFEEKVNKILKEHNARVVQTEMSVCDHQYVAMIVISKIDKNESEKP
jgi:proline dehydrogenase